MSASVTDPPRCWFVPAPRVPRITLVYVHPMVLEAYHDLATRFVSTLLTHPPGHPARLIVVCNGERAKPSTRDLFRPLHGTPTHPSFATHDNSGHDIGAYQYASRTFSDCDLMVFFGASTYFRRAGWLQRLVEATDLHGPGLYGAMANAGNPFGCHPHIRTTAFCTPPTLFNAYPRRITRPEQRYPFEHGPQCLTGWYASEGLPTLVVSWTGEHARGEWHAVPGGFHVGTQDGLLIGDRMSCPPFHPHA